MKNVIHKFITDDGSVRVSSVVCTDVINEAHEIHKTFPIASAALGRTLIAAGLLASFLKEEGRVGLHFKGDGPLGAVFGEGNFEGDVRGMVTYPQVHLPSRNGKLNVGEGVGKGSLSVVTSLPHEKQPYTGTVELQSGEIGEDVAYYLFQSQQTPSVVALGVFVESDNRVSAAGGSILQVMPGVSDEVLEALENRTKNMRMVTEMIREGATANDLAFEMLEDFKFREITGQSGQLGEKIAPVTMQYKCHCSRVRVERSLLLLGEKELGALVADKKDVEINCDFCGRNYLVDQELLGDLLNISKKKLQS